MIIHEASHLSFGFTGRNARVVPDEVFRYKQYVLPPGTPVSMTTLYIHTAEDIFTDLWTFNLDRFLGREQTERRKYMMFMGRGLQSDPPFSILSALLPFPSNLRFPCNIHLHTKHIEKIFAFFATIILFHEGM